MYYRKCLTLTKTLTPYARHTENPRAREVQSVPKTIMAWADLRLTPQASMLTKICAAHSRSAWGCQSEYRNENSNQVWRIVRESSHQTSGERYTDMLTGTNLTWKKHKPDGQPVQSEAAHAPFGHPDSTPEGFHEVPLEGHNGNCEPPVE